MTISRSICLLIVIVSVSASVTVNMNQTLDEHHVNGTRLEALEEVVPDRIDEQVYMDNYVTRLAKQGYTRRLDMMERIKTSSIPETSKFLEEIQEMLTYMRRLNSLFMEIDLLLFGPPRNPMIHPVRDHGLPLVDDWKCYKSTVELFEKHCGLINEYFLGHMATFVNICNNLIDMDAVEEAFKVSCNNISEPLAMSRRKSLEN